MTEPPTNHQPVILRASRLTVELGGGSGWLHRRRGGVRAVADVSLELRQGEILGLVGESGSGKTTMARTLLGIQRESSGEITLDGKEVSGLPPDRARAARRDIQYVHQDAAATLDPWWRIGASLHETLKVGGIADRAQRTSLIATMMNVVGLDESATNRYVHELSGGQLRRVALARVLLLQPRIVILDEPTAGLDMSVQVTVLRLLLSLRQKFDLTYLLISHDLGMVQRLCDRVAILYLGRIVEAGPTRELFAQPRHPYTRALLDATLGLEPGSKLMKASGGNEDEKDGEAKPAACPYSPRCPRAASICTIEAPELERVTPDHEVACLRWR